MSKPENHEGVTDGLDDASQEALDEIRARAKVEAEVSPENAFGRAGQPFDMRSPFFIGFIGALGVACAFALAYVVVAASEVLILLGLAFFLAVGLDPAVRWIHRRGLPRWTAVVIVLTGVLAIVAGFVATAAPVVATQASHLAAELPHYYRELNRHNTELGRLNRKYHITRALQKLLRG
ncbi:MAG: AI-2E family transporter, partial [Solirubrobacteraceae bacterium]